MKSRKDKRNREGVALLVVLFVVMAVTILSLGFLSRSDVELSCGENMILRTQMDFLVESGLEHARGLILNPQDVGSEYWDGAVRQQLVAGTDDYYDVEVVKLGEGNYQITCDAYRESGGERIGCSGLKAEVRLDPSVAFWSGADTRLHERVTITGDVYCNGALTSEGVINGDAFVNSLSGSISGRQKPVGDLSLRWPGVTVADFTSKYPVELVGAYLAGVTFGPYDPVRVCYRSGDLELDGGVQIEGMLVVEGNLTIRGNGNTITAAKNLPAFLVTGDVMIEDGGQLTVGGLGLVNGQMGVSGGFANVGILGALFARDGLAETTADSSGNGYTAALYNGPSWRPLGGQAGGALEFDGVDDKVEEPRAGSYLNGLPAVTVSLWVRSDVTNENRGILFSRDPTGADEELGIRYEASGAFGGGVNGIKASIRTTLGYTQIESSSNVQTSGWQHLAVVWESGLGLKLYINGNFNPLGYDSGPVSGTVSGVQKLMLGCGTKGRYWDGLLDDVRIYGRALDPNEIWPPSDAVPGLEGHWKFDEGGSSVVDITSAPSKSAILVWSAAGVGENWSPAGGAFYRSIERR